MKIVIITLDEDVARWARIRAAARDISFCRLVGELLREKMIEEETYQAAISIRAAQRIKKPGRQVSQTAGTT
jgi:plasmid stability protein